MSNIFVTGGVGKQACNFHQTPKLLCEICSWRILLAKSAGWDMGAVHEGIWSYWTRAEVWASVNPWEIWNVTSVKAGFLSKRLVLCLKIDMCLHCLLNLSFWEIQFFSPFCSRFPRSTSGLQFIMSHQKDSKNLVLKETFWFMNSLLLSHNRIPFARNSPSSTHSRYFL